MRFLPLLLITVFLLTTIGAGDMIGEPVRLSGRALGYDQVYLFVTGPGLAKSGVNPERMNSPVVTGSPQSFVVVETDGNGYWQYRWRTTRVGITLDEGLYTVYAATKPVSKQDLSGVAYDSTGIRMTYIRPDTGSPTPLMTHTGTVEQSIAPETNQTTSAPPPVYEIPVETIATTRALIPGPITAFAVISGALLFAMKNVRK